MRACPISQTPIIFNLIPLFPMRPSFSCRPIFGQRLTVLSSIPNPTARRPAPLQVRFAVATLSEEPLPAVRKRVLVPRSSYLRRPSRIQRPRSALPTVPKKNSTRVPPIPIRTAARKTHHGSLVSLKFPGVRGLFSARGGRHESREATPGNLRKFGRVVEKVISQLQNQRLDAPEATSGFYLFLGYFSYGYLHW